MLWLAHPRNSTAAFAMPAQDCNLPVESEAQEYQAAADTVIQLLQVEGELIRTGRAPGGSAANVDAVLPSLLPRLTHEQQHMVKCGNKYKLCEAKDELRLLAALLKDTQKEHKMIVHSVSDLELQNKVGEFAHANACSPDF